MSLLIFVCFIGGAAWLVRRSVRNLFLRSPLDKIPGPPPPSYIKGNLGQLYDRQNNVEFLGRLGSRYNKVVKLTGFFGHRMLYVFDPKALQQVVYKDLDLYNIPDWQLEVNRMTIGHGLSGVGGDRHRLQRKLLYPAFSVKQMRLLTPLFYGLAHKLRSGIEAEVGTALTGTTVDILGWFGRAGLEYIGQGGLGYSFDPLDKPVPNVFGDALKQLFPLTFAMSEWQLFAKYLKKLGTASFRSAVADCIPLARLQELKQLVTTIERESKAIIADKRGSVQNNEGHFGEAPDAMDILLRANMAASESERLEEDELVGQMSHLVLAGTDSTSNTLSVIMQILAQRLDIQDRLRAEVLEAQEQYGEDIPYDELAALPYMDAICREALRLHPPLTYSYREATKDVIMPLSEPILGDDGIPMTEIPVPAGTTILVGIHAANIDKDIWGYDTMEFKPERWLFPLPQTVIEARLPGVYSNLMSFLGGGRSCIGFKFSQLEMKILLATLIPKFRVSPAEQTRDVVWNISIVRYPTIGKESRKPELPIKLERIVN